MDASDAISSKQAQSNQNPIDIWKCILGYVHKYLSETKAKVLEINACLANQILEMILNHHKKLLFMVFALFFLVPTNFCRLTTMQIALLTITIIPPDQQCAQSQHYVLLIICHLVCVFLNAYQTKVLDVVAHEV